MLPSAVRNRLSLIDLLEELGALSPAPLAVCASGFQEPAGLDLYPARRLTPKKA